MGEGHVIRAGERSVSTERMARISLNGGMYVRVFLFQRRPALSVGIPLGLRAQRP